MKTFSSWLTLETYHIFDVQTTVAGVGRVKSQGLLGIRNSLQTYEVRNTRPSTIPTDEGCREVTPNRVGSSPL